MPPYSPSLRRGRCRLGLCERDASDEQDIQRAIGEKLKIALPVKQELSSANKRNILGYQTPYLKHHEASDASMKEFLGSFPDKVLNHTKTVDGCSSMPGYAVVLPRSVGNSPR